MVFAVLAGTVLLRADLPPDGVRLSVKPLSIREFRDPPGQIDYGSHDKSVTKWGALEIEARRTVRGDPCVSVEWYFLARDAATRKPFVFDAARVEVILEEGNSKKFSVAFGTGSDSGRRPAASGSRHKAGAKPWGWVVIVRSGKSIIASEASLFEVREWFLKALQERTVDRAPLARK